MKTNPNDISLETIEMLCSRQLLRLPEGGQDGLL